MLTYTQIEAIHAAMRELEDKVIPFACGPVGPDVDPNQSKTVLVALAGDVYQCLFKICAALAGEKDDVDAT